jgi:hypothetical protein
MDDFEKAIIAFRATYGILLPAHVRDRIYQFNIAKSINSIVERRIVCRRNLSIRVTQLE